MTARTIVLFFESRLITAAVAIVMIFSSRHLLATYRIVILPAELLSTCPAPSLTTSSPHNKSTTNIKATRKNISTRIIFQAPTLAPGALLRISRSTFGHIL
jgi:hypothetical protein